MKLVVFSIDKYSRIGPMFWDYLKDKWPQHFDSIFIANSLPINVSAPVVHVPARDMNFGRRMRLFLKDHYTDPYLMLMMIDYIPKNANDGLLRKSAKLIETDSSIGHIRLRPMPPPRWPYDGDEDYGIIDKRKPYSLSLQPGMWESQLLYDLCRVGENAWHTETHGSTRTHHFPQTFLCTWKMAISHHNYYIKGRISPIPPNASWRIRGGREE